MNAERAMELPLLPLGGGVLLAPPMARAFGLGRPASIAAARSVSVGEELVFSSLRDQEGEMSGKASVFDVGAAAIVVEAAATSQQAVRIFVEAVRRVRLRKFTLQRDGFYKVSVEPWDDPPTDDVEIRALYHRAVDRFEVLRRRSGLPEVTTEIILAAAPIDHPTGIRALPWVVMSHLGQDAPPHWIAVAQRQALLAAPSLPDRLRLLVKLLDEADPPDSLAADVTPFILRAASTMQLT